VLGKTQSPSRSGHQHHPNHNADAWSIQMSDQEEPAPSAPVSETGDDEVGSDAEQASSARKRRKTGLTKCEDEYAVSKQRKALSAKANTSKFSGLRAETPAKRSSAKTPKQFSVRCWFFSVLI